MALKDAAPRLLGKPEKMTDEEGIQQDFITNRID
jgi:hypothetical protein